MRLRNGTRAAVAVAVGTVGLAAGTGQAGAADTVHLERNDTYTVTNSSGQQLTCPITSRLTFAENTGHLEVVTLVSGRDVPDACLDGILLHEISFTTTSGQHMTMTSEGASPLVLTSIDNGVAGDVQTEHWAGLPFCECSSPKFALPK